MSVVGDEYILLLLSSFFAHILLFLLCSLSNLLCLLSAIERPSLSEDNQVPFCKCSSLFLNSHSFYYLGFHWTINPGKPQDGFSSVVWVVTSIFYCHSTLLSHSLSTSTKQWLHALFLLTDGETHSFRLLLLLFIEGKCPAQWANTALGTTQYFSLSERRKRIFMVSGSVLVN